MPPATSPGPAVAVALACLLAPSLARAEGGLRKGPWLMDPRPDSIVVMVERDAPGPVLVRAWALDTAGALADGGSDGGLGGAADVLPPAAGSPVEVSDTAPVALHEVRLGGLAAGARYRYEVSGPGIAPAPDGHGPGGTFTVPPSRDRPFRFVVYGDTRSQAEVHRAVVEAIRRQGPDFVVHTGDLVEDGRDETLWQNFFDIEAPLLRDVPLVPVIGNHEIVRPTSSAGIEHFRRYMHVDSSGPAPELDYAFRYANVRFVLANAYDDWTGAARDWLEAELTRARREAPDAWLVVVMHWGPRSSGPHGDNPAVRAAGVDDLLRRARVDLVLSGHDHTYERGDDNGLRYLVTGGAGAPLYPRAQPEASSLVFASAYHFVRVDVDRDRVVVDALRIDGTALDHAVLRHAGWEGGARPSSPDVGAPGHPSRHAPSEPADEDGCGVSQSLPRVLPGALAVAGVGGYLGLRRSRRRPPPRRR